MESNISNNPNTGTQGLNLDSSTNQIKQGQLSYALNAIMENFDQNSVSVQNEPGNELCIEFPEGYQLIGKHSIIEQNKHIFFLVNPTEGKSEIGYMENNDCIYRTLVNADCLNFSIDHPIHKVVHKITNCATEIYWPDGFNERRFLDITDLTKIRKIKPGTDVCDNQTINEIDCNKFNIQPDFEIPLLEVTDDMSGGNLTAGTIQFAIQYSDVNGNGYTSFMSITNPLPIADPQIISSNFNYPVDKSVILNIRNLDISGYFEHFNLAVIKTVNNIPSVELVGTYFIDNSTKEIIYTGQNQTQIKLTIQDIFEKYPQYNIADDVTVVQDVLVWKGLTSAERINYQQIANKVTLQWETYRIPNTEDYSNELNAANLRGYLRDEIYPFELVWLLTGGVETDGFHIPGRAKNATEFTAPDVLATDPDYILDEGSSAPYWQIYNTAKVLGTDAGYTNSSDYKGPYQYGDFAYWESSETYPCNTNVWGELAGQPIRHHKFPDVLVSPIFENPSFTVEGTGTYSGLVMQKNAIFPIGVKVDVNQIKFLIEQSDLTRAQKDAIIGFKVVRGNRDVNKSIVAKGILRNVGKYTREGTDYYFPNYPYNDLREDPFLLSQSNAYNSECITYQFTATSAGTYQYTNCFTNKIQTVDFEDAEEIRVCSLSTPTILVGTTDTIEVLSIDTYQISVINAVLFNYIQFNYTNTDGELTYIRISEGQTRTIDVQSGTTITVSSIGSVGTYSITQVEYKNTECYPSNLEAFEDDASKYRHVFNSPETSFGQPFLGNVLKLENVLFGAGKAHFVEVKNNALYKLISKEGQEDALLSSGDIASVGGFSSAAMFTTYQAYLQIYLNGITRKNYGWSYNSILGYDYYSNIANGLGIKQRKLDDTRYLLSGVQSVGESINLNNFQRESSVYVRTDEDVTSLPFPNQTTSLALTSTTSRVTDESRFINSQKDCSQPEEEFDISSVVYYGSLKNVFPNQWGQIYSYETIDTGTQIIFDEYNENYVTAFGGDTFISKFAFKTKLPFFIDNRVNAPDDSDIFYDEIGNVAYPEYWHSARSILYDYKYDTQPVFKNIISIKAHYFDCSNSQLPVPDSEATPPIVNPGRTYYDGKMYMFAYGIPSFYCESSINVDLRQAFNTREGEFYPHVSQGIPDEWLQQTFVPIAQDNTYFYNVTYSKQNKENNFTHLPPDWEDKLCFTHFPFRVIYSEIDAGKMNGWLVYRPISYFDFPQHYGDLISIDGIDSRQLLTRFENKTLIYNALYTNQTDTGGQVYLGQTLFSPNSPPLDFAETDLGYIGTQHKFLLKIPQGQVTVDAKRGQIFILSGSKAVEISALGVGLTRFLNTHLPFKILEHFPETNIDNHFNGIGLHGVYDNKYNRIIISKLDYTPLSDDIKWDQTTNTFYIERLITDTELETTVTIREQVYLTDPNYFCNKSWTLSYSVDLSSWTSFHSYIPNWYIAENNFFYSGLKDGCDLELIAYEEVEPTPTTSTTSTQSPFDCELEGEAIQVEVSPTTSTTSTTTTTTTAPIDCDLEGEAYLWSETTSTTTTTA